MFKTFAAIATFGFVLTGANIETGYAQQVNKAELDANMKAFQPPAEGMVRYVIHLPPQADDSAFQVELIVGKTVQVDEVNRYFFAGKIVESNIEGWGFPRYDVAQLGPMAGTRVGVDPDAPKVDRFVTLGGEPYMVRYNSRLPIVVYVPAGTEVRYRVWTAGYLQPAPQG